MQLSASSDFTDIQTGITFQLFQRLQSVSDGQWLRFHAGVLVIQMVIPWRLSPPHPTALVEDSRENPVRTHHSHAWVIYARDCMRHRNLSVSSSVLKHRRSRSPSSSSPIGRRTRLSTVGDGASPVAAVPVSGTNYCVNVCRGCVPHELLQSSENSYI